MAKDWKTYYKKKFQQRQEKYNSNEQKLKMIRGYAKAYLDYLSHKESKIFKGTVMKK
jgi:hypothetical protein